MHLPAQETNQPRPYGPLWRERSGAGGVQQEGDQLEIGPCRLNQHDPSSAHHRRQDQKEVAQRPLSKCFRRLLFKCIASILSSGHKVSGLALVRGAAPPFNPPRSAVPNGTSPKPQRRLCPCTPEKRFCDEDRDTNHTGGEAALAGDC